MAKSVVILVAFFWGSLSLGIPIQLEYRFGNGAKIQYSVRDIIGKNDTLTFLDKNGKALWHLENPLTGITVSFPVGTSPVDILHLNKRVARFPTRPDLAIGFYQDTRIIPTIYENTIPIIYENTILLVTAEGRIFPIYSPIRPVDSLASRWIVFKSDSLYRVIYERSWETNDLKRSLVFDAKTGNSQTVKKASEINLTGLSLLPNPVPFAILSKYMELNRGKDSVVPEKSVPEFLNAQTCEERLQEMTKQETPGNLAAD